MSKMGCMSERRQITLFWEHEGRFALLSATEASFFFFHKQKYILPKQPSNFPFC